MPGHLYDETYLTSIVIGGLSSIVIGSNGLDPGSSPSSGNEMWQQKLALCTILINQYHLQIKRNLKTITSSSESFAQSLLRMMLGEQTRIKLEKP